jgi:hypothetical protein
MLLAIAKDAAGTPYLDVCGWFVTGLALMADHTTANMGYFSVHGNNFSSSILTMK